MSRSASAEPRGDARVGKRPATRAEQEIQSHEVQEKPWGRSGASSSNLPSFRPTSLELRDGLKECRARLTAARSGCNSAARWPSFSLLMLGWLILWRRP